MGNHGIAFAAMRPGDHDALICMVGESRRHPCSALSLGTPQGKWRLSWRPRLAKSR
jgi:hypothetical protein